MTRTAALPRRAGTTFDRQRAAPDGLPRRACIVSHLNPYANRSGSAAYLHHFAESLDALGVEVTLLILSELAPGQLRIGIDDGFLRPYAEVRVRGTLRRGSRFYARHPRHWIGRFARKPLQQKPRPPWNLPPPAPEALDWAARSVAALGPDLVVANYFNAADVFARLPGTRKAILIHDVMALRAESLAAAGLEPDFEPAMIARETAAFRTADLCLAIKPEEAAHVRAVAPGARAAVFPHAVETPEIELAAPRPPVAVFVGTLAAPNVDALRWLLADVWPAVHAARPDARLRVLGRVVETVPGPWPAGAESVGFVPDLSAEYARAAVALVPLRFGSGVKIKLIEALGHGLPVVATRIGAEGVRPAPERILRVADGAAAFADALLAALADPDPAAARRDARDFAARHYARAAVLGELRAALGDPPGRTDALRTAAGGTDSSAAAAAREAGS